MKSTRIDFTQGISAVMDPKLIGNGYAVFLENVDMDGLTLRSARAPAFIQEVPPETKDIFEYRGKWHFTPGRREWTAEYVGRQERLYFKDVEPGTLDRRPYKMIDNVTALLGSPRPITTPALSTTDPLAPLRIDAALMEGAGSLLAGSQTYRIGIRTTYGLIPASAPITITTTDKSAVRLSWSRISFDDIKKIVIYGRASTDEQIIDELEPSDIEFIDTGSIAPQGQFAAELDQSTLFYYFYTFLRNVNGHPDESGPSPTYGPLETNRARKIVRNPLFEGLFTNGFLFESGTMTVSATVRDEAIAGVYKRPTSNKTLLTTASAHGRATGDKVGVINEHYGNDAAIRDQIYGVVVPAVLPRPTVTSIEEIGGAPGGWLEGTVLSIGVAAFRGASWGHTYSGRPAETAVLSGDLVSLTVGPADGNGRQVVKVKWSFISGETDGFHIYLNGGLIGTVGNGNLYFEFGQISPNMACPSAETDSSRTHSLILQKDAGEIGWEEFLAAAAGKWGDLAYDPRALVTITGGPDYTPRDGDLLYFSSGFPQIPGYHAIKDADAAAGTFFVEALAESTWGLAGTWQCRIAGPQARFIDSWNIYVARNDTGAFLLQGTYPIDQTEVIDAKPVEALGGTCGSDYYTQGANGEALAITFSPPPPDIHGLVLHGNSLWGIVDRTVCWTPINRPDAFPKAYRRDFPGDPLAIVPYAGTLIILCSDGPYRMDGVDPSAMSCHETLSKDGIIAPYSAMATPEGLIYLSARGLVAYRADLNNTIPVSQGKIAASVLTSASGTPEEDPFPFWAIPSRWGAFWAKLTKRLPAATPDRIERGASGSLPLTWPQNCIRAYVSESRYHLYYSKQKGVANAFKMHGTVIVDCSKRELPITLSGVKPVAAHVGETDRTFLLLDEKGSYGFGITEVVGEGEGSEPPVVLFSSDPIGPEIVDLRDPGGAFVLYYFYNVRINGWIDFPQSPDITGVTIERNRGEGGWVMIGNFTPEEWVSAGETFLDGTSGYDNDQSIQYLVTVLRGDGVPSVWYLTVYLNFPQP